MKKTTIYDVAKKAGVSKTTVSKFLNGKGNVKESTRTKINNAICELNYIPNCFAQSMRTNSTKTIAILLPEQYNYGYTSILKSAQEYANKEGYLSLVCSTGTHGENELDYLKEMYRRKVDGILFFTYSRIEANIAYLQSIAKDMAIVVMDNILKEEKIDCVRTDGYTLSKKGAQYLIESGCKSIAYIKGKDIYLATKERYAGYLSAVSKAGLLPMVIESEFTVEGGYLGVLQLLNAKRLPGAIMCATDLLAIGGLNCLREHNISVPKQVKLMGFDNTPFCKWTTPKLTTISQNHEEIGQTGVKQLLLRIKNKELPTTEKLIKGELIIREST